MFLVLKEMVLEYVGDYLQCCVQTTRPGRSHSVVRLHNVLCLSPLKMNVIRYKCAECLKNRIDHILTATKYMEFSVGSWSIYNSSLEPWHYSDEQYVCVKGPLKRSSCGLIILKGGSWVWLLVSTLFLSVLLAVVIQWRSWMLLLSLITSKGHVSLVTHIAFLFYCDILVGLQ